MNSNDADHQAGEWLARLDRDAPSPGDLAAFGQWRASDPRHAAAYARLASTWQALDRVRAVRPSADEPIDDDYLKNALRQAGAAERDSRGTADESVQRPISAPRSRSIRRRSAQRPWMVVSAAASVLLIVAGLWTARTFLGPRSFSTSIGGYQRVVLEDQSTVQLNTDSEVRVAMTAQLRKVELVRGEASFEVAHDTARPFIVSAGATAVRAVGTKFDVRRLGSSVEVTVDEGRVAVGDPSLLENKGAPLDASIPQLSAGESALASRSGVQLKELPKQALARKLAWQNQMLVFDGDTLTEVVSQFNRYNQRQLVIADRSLAQLQIGGYFRTTNLDAFISVLQSDFGIRVNIDGNRLVLAMATAN
jgi:transmembrane sensor